MFRTLMLGTSLLRLTPAFFDGNVDNNDNPPIGEKGEKGEKGENKWVPTAEQQAEINRIAAAERRDAEEKARIKFENEQAEKKRLEDEERERNEATKRGEFDKVKSQLEQKASDAENKAKTAEEQVTFLRSFVDKTLEREVAELPDSFKAFDPGPDADLSARLKWLETARAEYDKLEEEKAPKPTGGGARPPKRPSGSADNTVKKEVHRAVRRRSL